MMKECWTVDVTKRPMFASLRLTFEGIVSDEVSGYYVQLDQPYHQFNQENVYSSREIVTES